MTRYSLTLVQIMVIFILISSTIAIIILSLSSQFDIRFGVAIIALILAGILVVKPKLLRNLL